MHSSGTSRSIRNLNRRQEYQAQNKVAEWVCSGYVQVTRKLTIDIGMRFSWFTPWYSGKGLGAEFVQSKYEPISGTAVVPARSGSQRRAGG